MSSELIGENLPRIKICGITNPEDALAVSEAGADAIGLVFYAPSPRAVTIDQAKNICAVLGPFTTVVGLFVDASADVINDVLINVPLHVLQFHGEENPEFCQQFQRPWIKAVRMKPETNLLAKQNQYESASAILVDSYTPGVPGGTGKVFDWAQVDKEGLKPLVLAGGLQADNVTEAIQQLRPYAVDVSGGVEKSSGKKDIDKVKRFIAAVKAAV